MGAMFTVTESITIARPVDEVFAFLADGRNRAKWDTSVISEELTSPPPLGVGSTLHTRMRVMSREVEFDWRVTRFDSPRRMAIESTAGMLPTSFLLEFTDAGEATGVVATVAGEPRGMLRLGEPMIAESVRATLATGLARAKRLLEERQR
jgi:uncharacterized membrane protein